jgi:hypothetical protein
VIHGSVQENGQEALVSLAVVGKCWTFSSTLPGLSLSTARLPRGYRMPLSRNERVRGNRDILSTKRDVLRLETLRRSVLNPPILTFVSFCVRTLG